MITLFHGDETKAVSALEDVQSIAADSALIGGGTGAFCELLQCALNDTSAHNALVRTSTTAALFRIADICGQRLLLSWPDSLTFASMHDASMEKGITAAARHFRAFNVQYRVPTELASSHRAALGYSLRSYVCETALVKRQSKNDGSTGPFEYVSVRAFTREVQDFMASRELLVRLKAPGTTFLGNDKFPVIVEEYAGLLDSGALNGTLAMREGKIIGMLTWIRLSEEYAQGSLFWVSPMLQGSGVGKELARLAFAQASEECRRMRSVISSSNPRSLGAALANGARVESLVFAKDFYNP